MLVQDDWHGPAPTHPSCVALLLMILFCLFPLVLTVKINKVAISKYILFYFHKC